MVFLPLWVTLFYFPIAHMVFSCTDDGARSAAAIGAQDYAGGTAVHINAGVAGLVLALDHRQAARLRPRSRCGRTT